MAKRMSITHGKLQKVGWQEAQDFPRAWNSDLSPFFLLLRKGIPWLMQSFSFKSYSVSFELLMQ